jgi:hypothetical protein
MKIPPNIPLYGDPTWRGECATETAEAVTFFNAIRKTKWGGIAIHIKNEGKRKHGQAAWDRAQGMVKGASDIIIPGSPTFVCELKRKDHTRSKISDEQVAYLDDAMKMGAFACVALGWEAAWEAVRVWDQS